MAGLALAGSGFDSQRVVTGWPWGGHVFFLLRSADPCYTLNPKP